MFTVADETISRGARAYRARAGGDGGARPRADLAVGTRGHLPHVSDAGRVPGPDPVRAPSRERRPFANRAAGGVGAHQRHLPTHPARSAEGWGGSPRAPSRSGFPTSMRTTR